MGVIQPQKGYQTKFLSSPADIIVGGSAAGVGKTAGLLIDFVRHVNVPRWGGVIFRRTSPQIRAEGGLWDTSKELYGGFKGALPKESTLEWEFKGKSSLKFSHLEYEKNVIDWQGAQIPFIGFDELTHFSENMFFYLLSRNRSTCGIKPVVRATCNPDPESWVAEFIKWWIDQETGFPIPERDGVIRYMIKYGKDYIWGDSIEQVYEQSKHILDPLIERSGLKKENFIKSVTFISGSIYDNRILLEKDPGYLANLLSQSDEVRAQLLENNWKTVISDLDIYDYTKFCGVFQNVMEVNRKGKYITADIAGKGSNMFVVKYWEGMELMDIELMAKSNGPEVIQTIENMATVKGVQNSNIVFDADGIGGLVDGFIPGSIPFNGGGSVKEVQDTTSGRMIKEPYPNLRTQCYYRSGNRVQRGEMKINEHVANKMYDDKMTVRQRFMWERKAIKRAKIDSDGKFQIISKAEMKVKLNGESPDLFDAFMMREYFELAPKFEIAVG